MRILHFALLTVATLGACGHAMATDAQPPTGALTTPVDPFTAAQHAAENDASHARPPVGSADLHAPAHAQVNLVPPTVNTAAPDANALRSLVAATKENLTVKVTPPPPDLTVKDGVTELINVAVGRMNRLITPFPDPIIKFKNTSTVDVSRAGSILYVLPNGSDSVSMFIMDRSDPLHAMSLTLVPAAIPPVQVTLHMADWKAPPPKPIVSADPDSVNSDEPYIQVITRLFRDIALGKIPQGFAFSTLPPDHAPQLRCRIPGVRVEAKQWLEGHSIDAVVARAVNASLDPVDIVESDCRSDSVLAVAAWPRVHLEPGQATEIYVALHRHDPTDTDTNRPSVLAGPGE